MTQIEVYMDSLYDDSLAIKIDGAKRILSICTSIEGLEFIAESDSVLNVLSRIMRDDCKLLSDLPICIASCFLCFAQFEEYHALLRKCQCGDVTMRALEYEVVKRSAALADNKDPLVFQRQDRLLHIIVLVLLHLAQDLSVERKMMNRKLSDLLVPLLQREYNPLVFTVLEFLLKLSVFEEYKELLISMGVVDNLVKFGVANSKEEISFLSLSVLYNLSFDSKTRVLLTENGDLKLLIDFLKIPAMRGSLMRVIYQVSCDERARVSFSYYPEVLSIFFQMAIAFPETFVGKELVGTLINLACNSRVSSEMITCCASEIIAALVSRMMDTNDCLLCKFFKNLLLHEHVKLNLLKELGSSKKSGKTSFALRVVKCLTCSDFEVMFPSSNVGDSFYYEILGVLANLNIADHPDLIDWVDFLEKRGLSDLLCNLVKTGDDSLVLESIMIAGNAAVSKKAVELLLPFVKLLIPEFSLLSPSDPEIACQGLHFLLKIVTMHESIEFITSIPAYSDFFACLLHVLAEHGVLSVKQRADALIKYMFSCMHENDTKLVIRAREEFKQVCFNRYNNNWVDYWNNSSLEEMGVGNSNFSPESSAAENQDNINSRIVFADEWEAAGWGGDEASEWHSS